MTVDLDDAFETDSLILNDRAAVLSGDADPNTPGLIAPIGSYYLRTNGLHYRKTGALDNQWTQTDVGGGSVPDQLQFFNRAGAPEFITIVLAPTTHLPFFNRAGGTENIGII
jgi:hypothetical protein